MLNTIAFGLVALAFLVFCVVAFVLIVAWLVRLAKPAPKPAQPAPAVLASASPLLPMAPRAHTPEVNLLNLARDYNRMRVEEEEIATARRTLDQVVFFAAKLPTAPTPIEPPAVPNA